MANLSDFALSIPAVLKDRCQALAEFPGLGRSIFSKFCIIALWHRAHDYNLSEWVMIAISVVIEAVYKSTYVFGPNESEEKMVEFWLWAAWRCLLQSFGGLCLMDKNANTTTQQQKDKQWNLITIHFWVAVAYSLIWVSKQELYVSAPGKTIAAGSLMKLHQDA